jgi:hypothetical protein
VKKELEETGRIRIAGACVALVLTVGATSATVAAAEVPELGRCVKVEPVKEGKKNVFKGAYGGANCLKLKANHKGSYEFLPGPGPNNKYFGETNEPEPVLETVGGKKITCVSAEFKGEYTGAKTESVTVGFSGCETPAHATCQSNPAVPEEIVALQAFDGELAAITTGGKKPSVGWDLKHEGALFTIECGKAPEVPVLETIEGSVIGEVAAGPLSNLDRMNIESVVKYKQKAGKQLPEAFEGRASDTLVTNFVAEKTSEQTGLTATEEELSGLGEPIEKPENQEPLEIKAK